jgi:hypothetical protein
MFDSSDEPNICYKMEWFIGFKYRVENLEEYKDDIIFKPLNIICRKLNLKELGFIDFSTVQNITWGEWQKFGIPSMFPYLADDGVVDGKLFGVYDYLIDSDYYQNTGTYINMEFSLDFICQYIDNKIIHNIVEDWITQPKIIKIYQIGYFCYEINI